MRQAFFRISVVAGVMIASGVATAFIIYPSAVASLTNVSVVNAIFGSAIGFTNNLYYSKRWKI